MGSPSRIMASPARLVETERPGERKDGRVSRPRSAPTGHLIRRELEVRYHVAESVATSSRIRNANANGRTGQAFTPRGANRKEIAVPVVRFCPWCSCAQPEFEGHETLSRCTGCRRVFN